MIINSYKKGLLVEFFAIFILFIKGYKLLKFRYRSVYGEIDLIFNKNNNLVFVEVKYRKKEEELSYVLSNKQMSRISRSSQLFIKQNKQFHNMSYRYDLFFVSGFIKIKHIKNISFEYKLC